MREKLFRSGDRVINTVVVASALVTLLSPFIAAAVKWMDASFYYLEFGPDYTKVVEGTLEMLLVAGAAKFHMMRIQREGAE
jgi:hypothetical protein